MTRRSFDESGVVGGADALIFGVLIFVAGTLIALNAWSVIDTKFAAQSAAREAARAYVESDNGREATQAAFDAATEVATSEHRTLGTSGIQITDANGDAARFGRCQRIVVEVELTAPRTRMPFLSAVMLDTPVHARHSEIVDPYRAGIEGDTARAVDCA